MRMFCRIWVLSSLFLFFTGCGVSSPTIDYDPVALRLPRSSFAVENRGSREGEPLDAERVERAVTTQLRAKGYTLSSRPDFVVTYELYTHKDVPSAFTFGFGIGSYGYHGGGSVGTSVTPFVDLVGLRIDMRDAGTRRIFWHAESEKRLPDFTTPESRSAFFDDMVRSLLAKFPKAWR